MDLARPSGVVLDGAFGVEMLEKETQDLFVAEDVYIRSVAEEEPKKVYILEGVVEIAETAKRPLRLEHWECTTRSLTVRQWRQVDDWFYIPLDRPLKRADGMIVQIKHQTRHAGKVVDGLRHFELIDKNAYEYMVVGNAPLVFVKRDWVLAYAKTKRLPLAEQLKVEINYVPG
jgi:hypothetical protein